MPYTTLSPDVFDSRYLIMVTLTLFQGEAKPNAASWIGYRAPTKEAGPKNAGGHEWQTARSLQIVAATSIDRPGLSAIGAAMHQCMRYVDIMEEMLHAPFITQIHHTHVLEPGEAHTWPLRICATPPFEYGAIAFWIDPAALPALHKAKPCQS